MLNTEKRTYCTPTSTVRPGACSTPPNTAATRRVWAVSLQNKFAYDKKLYTINTKNQSRAYTTPETNNERAPRGNEMKPKRPGYFSLAESTGTALCNPYRSTASENRSLPVKCTSIPATLWFINFKNTPFGNRSDAPATQKDKPFINLNFFTMKKQILLLAVFTLATLFAGTSKVFGQLSPGVTDPDGSNQSIPELSCISSSEPLHPYAGVSYTYALSNGSGEETSANWTWWATKDPEFITAEGTFNLANMLLSPTTTTAGTDLVATSTDYGVDNSGTTNGSASVDITWSSSILAATEYQGDATNWSTASSSSPTPTFVVGYSEGVNCADNIQVFEINPLSNFTIDIAPIDTAVGTLPWDDVSLTNCVDEIQSASYNSTSKELDMDYGVNVLYFEVAAANFVTDWTPTFQILSGLATTQTADIYMYASLADAQANSSSLFSVTGLGVADMNTDIATNTALTAADDSYVSTGVSVYVKVVIHNNTEESLTSSTFTLAVDAQDETGTGIWDMDDADCGVDVTTITADQDDQAVVTITPRPTLEDATTPETIANPDAPIIKTN